MKALFVLFTCFVITAMCAQKRQIDSLNGLPFDVKIAKAKVLDEVFLQNVKKSQKLKYQLGEAMSYSNLSLIYYYQGKYNLQVDNSLKAIRLFEKLKMMDKLAYEYASFGYSIKRRNMPKALYYMQKGKAIAEQNNDTTSLLSIYNNYGVLKEMKNELDSALYFYKKGLRIKVEVNDSMGIPYSLNNIAGIYTLKHDYPKAEKLLGEALNRRIALDDGIGIAENYSLFGDLHLMRKDYQKALGFYQKALLKSRQYNYIDLMRNCYKAISNIHEILGDEKLALENFKKYEQYKDSLVNNEMNSKIAELEVQFDTKNKEKLLAENKNLLLLKEVESQQKNSMLLMLSVLSVFIALTGFLIYRQQKLKNRQQLQEHDLKTAISQIETQNKLHEQRLSISRDLHDNIGAQLTFIISSVDNIRYAFDLKDTKLENRLQSINNFTKSTIIELRDTIWAMNHSEIAFIDLRMRIFNFIEKAKDAKQEIAFKFDIDNELNSIKLTSIIGMNVYHTIQEAINNAIKYSAASAIEIEIRKRDSAVQVSVKDNGKGFDQESVLQGNGLSNMKKRIRDINGDFAITSIVNEGTKIELRFEVVDGLDV